MKEKAMIYQETHNYQENKMLFFINFTWSLNILGKRSNENQYTVEIQKVETSAVVYYSLIEDYRFDRQV